MLLLVVIIVDNQNFSSIQISPPYSQHITIWHQHIYLESTRENALNCFCWKNQIVLGLFQKKYLARLHAIFLISNLLFLKNTDTHLNILYIYGFNCKCFVDELIIHITNASHIFSDAACFTNEQ